MSNDLACPDLTVYPRDQWNSCRGMGDVPHLVVAKHGGGVKGERKIRKGTGREMKTRETPPEPSPMNNLVNCKFLFPSAAQLHHRESDINYTDINFKN